MAKRHGTPISTLLLAVLWIIPPGPSHADPARLSLAQMKAANCAKADVDGDSYRPFYCDASCDCLATSSIAAVTACSETAPGTFTANLSQPTGPCIDKCITNVPEFGSYCASSPSGAPCTETADCPAGQFCIGAWGCVAPTCINDADCTGAPSVCENLTPVNCTSNSDCPDGRSCLTDPDGYKYCGELFCSQDSDCPDTDLLRLTLEDVADPDSPTPVPCSTWAVPDGNPGAIPINSNDALECIAQIEAAIGQSCTPIAP